MRLLVVLTALLLGLTLAAPALADSVNVKDFGVSPSATAAANTAALTAAAKFAYDQGRTIDYCVSSSNPATVKTNGAPWYGGMTILACDATVYQMQTTGPVFYTLPSPVASVPGYAICPDVAGIHIDQNNQDGVGLLFEGCWYLHLVKPHVENVPTGTWIHSDGVNLTGTYPDAAIMLKGITGVSGEYYNEIITPSLKNAASTFTGIGVWLGTTAGHTTQKTNVATIRGGWIGNFHQGVYDSCDGDVKVQYTDLSNNDIGRQMGGDGCTIIRPVNDFPYLEGDNTAGILLTADSKDYTEINSVASTSGTTTPVDATALASKSPMLIRGGRLFPDTITGEYQIGFPADQVSGIIQETVGNTAGIWACSMTGGTLNTRAAVSSATTGCSFSFYGDDGSHITPQYGGGLSFLTNNAWTSTDHSSFGKIFTVPPSSTTAYERVRFPSSGGVNITGNNGVQPTAAGGDGTLNVYGKIEQNNGESVLSRVAAPSTASDTCTYPQIAIPGGGGYIYVCVATNTWQRVATASW